MDAPSRRKAPMKKLMQALPFALVAVLAVLPAAMATPTVESSESSAPASESLCGRCGDGFCAKTCGETATSCPKDCGTAY
jgi:uncharacterized low-complexity protein